MSRRAKLTRADREKKAEKRERRAEGAVERIAQRDARERWRKIPRAKREMYQRIGAYYEWMTRSEPYPLASQVVCEKCLLAQPYVTDKDEGNFPTGDTGVTLCTSESILGIECDGEYCITIQRFSES